jgi:transcriptional regulator with XRE-family HTH domain
MDISYKELAEKADVSLSYATQLLSDDPEQHREPSRDMALKIYERTGLQLGFLKNLNTDDAATMLELEKKARAA